MSATCFVIGILALFVDFGFALVGRCLPLITEGWVKICFLIMPLSTWMARFWLSIKMPRAIGDSTSPWRGASRCDSIGNCFRMCWAGGFRTNRPTTLTTRRATMFYQICRLQSEAHIVQHMVPKVVARRGGKVLDLGARGARLFLGLAQSPWLLLAKKNCTLNTPIRSRAAEVSLWAEGKPPHLCSSLVARPSPFAIPAFEKPLELSVFGGVWGEPKAMYDLSTAFPLTTTHSVYAPRYSTRRAELRRFPFGRKGNLRSSAPLWSPPPFAITAFEKPLELSVLGGVW